MAVPDTLEGGGGSLRHSRRRVRLSKAFQEGAAAQGTPEEGGREGGREGGEAGRQAGWEEDHVAMRVQFFKKPRDFLFF